MSICKRQSPVIDDCNSQVVSIPDNFHKTICYDEHFSRHLALSADQITWREDVSPHFQHQIMQKFRLALLENSYLENVQRKYPLRIILKKNSIKNSDFLIRFKTYTGKSRHV